MYGLLFIASFLFSAFAWGVGVLVGIWWNDKMARKEFIKHLNEQAKATLN